MGELGGGWVQAGGVVRTLPVPGAPRVGEKFNPPVKGDDALFRAVHSVAGPAIFSSSHAGPRACHQLLPPLLPPRARKSTRGAAPFGFLSNGGMIEMEGRASESIDRLIQFNNDPANVSKHSSQTL